MNLVRLSCPSCGAKLEVGPNAKVFACGFCGTELAVQRAGGTVALEPVAEDIAGIRVSSDRTASELAIRRLQEEIAASQARGLEQHQKLVAELAGTRTDASQSIGATVILVIIVGSILAAVFASRAQVWNWGLILAVAGIAGVVYFVRDYRRRQAKAKALEAEIETSDAAAAEKIVQLQTQLARHRQIVDA